MLFRKKVNAALAVLKDMKNFQDVNQESIKTLADVAFDINISLSYAEQIARVLRQNCLIIGTRGPGGGQKLEMNISKDNYEYCHKSILELTKMFYPECSAINVVSDDFAEITLASIIG